KPVTHKPTPGGGLCPAPSSAAIPSSAAAFAAPRRPPAELQPQPPCRGLHLDPSAALGGSALRVRKERELGGFLSGRSMPRWEGQREQNATKFPSALAWTAAPYLL
ncbi:hypothetical protein HPG69_018707, partial [Diceros bicornis minor]